MPTVWFFIKGCPFPEECAVHKTNGVKKCLSWCGRTEQEAVDKCAGHLMNSVLHKKRKQVAYDAAWAAKMEDYEDDTDAEEGDEPLKDEGGAPGTPPRPSKRARMAIDNGGGGNRPPFEFDGDAAPRDPLVEELAARVERLVEARGRPSSSSSVQIVQAHSVHHVQTVRDAKEKISDAEAACRKAQSFALSAAQAFGDVASKLNRAWQTLED